MPRKKPLTRNQIRAARVTLRMAGEAYGGWSKVVLDASLEELATCAAYGGGTFQAEHEDSSTGTMVIVTVSVPDRPKKP